MKQFFLFLCICSFCPVVFAMECTDDEKLVRINGSQIGYNMYNEAMHANKANKCETCGEWKLTNKDNPDNLNIIGRALCLKSEEFNKDAETGPYCYCKIQEIDNYKVLSDWVNVKLYKNHVFDEEKKYSSENAKKMQQKYVNDKNRQECEDNCARICQSTLYKSIKAVNGYYVCDKALHKSTNVICTIGDKLVKAITIQVFNDIAEINTGDESIIFTKNDNDAFYTGEFEYEPVYLKIQNNSVYVGRKNYSMEECL